MTKIDTLEIIDRAIYIIITFQNQAKRKMMEELGCRDSSDVVQINKSHPDSRPRSRPPPPQKCWLPCDSRGAPVTGLRFRNVDSKSSSLFLPQLQYNQFILTPPSPSRSRSPHPPGPPASHTHIVPPCSRYRAHCRYAQRSPEGLALLCAGVCICPRPCTLQPVMLCLLVGDLLPW